MLKLKYLFENFDLARQCMEFYECDMASVDEMLRYFRISSNAIYPFQSKRGGRICFLRLSPVEEKKLDDVKSEICLMEWLIDKGFPAMRPVPMKDGKLFGQINTEWETYNVSCFEKVSGNSLEDTKGTLQIVKGYGKTLGELHALMKEYPYSEERRNHKMLLCEIEERMQKYGASEIVRKEFEDVRKELESIPLSTSDYGVIHYDFEPDNVFYDDKEESFSVIDFDDALCCWYALDVVRALDGFEFLFVRLAPITFLACDINYVIEQMELAMEGIGRMYSYWEGAKYTALYFYGTSFSEMKQKIEPFIATYPLCQKSRIEQIA